MRSADRVLPAHPKALTRTFPPPRPMPNASFQCCTFPASCLFGGNDAVSGIRISLVSSGPNKYREQPSNPSGVFVFKVVFFFWGGGLSFFFRPFSWFLLGKTLFSYGFTGSLLAFPRENTISYGFRVISFGFFLVFRRENTIFLRLLCHFLRFSEGKHTLAWLFLGKIRFS